MEQWGLTIAENKTFVLYVGQKNQKHKYFLNNLELDEVDCMKDLGVLIDNKLKFSEHINNSVKNAYFRCAQLFRVLKSGTINTWVTAYKSYVRPILEYATEAGHQN